MLAMTTPDTLLVFGGVYGNLAALEALLEWADKRGLNDSALLNTGDLIAYCADGAAVAQLMQKRPGIRNIRGNCERSVADDSPDCGCGFTPGSACDLLATAWFTHAKNTIPQADKTWLGNLPEQLTFTFNNRKITALHASAQSDNQFIFPSTDKAEKAAQIQALDADAVICGHSGIPFTQELTDKTGRTLLWHNSGALGMPANDGTPRTWFSLWQSTGQSIQIDHIPLDYPVALAQTAMQQAALPPDYRQALATGLWPSEDILPNAERALRGRPLNAQHLSMVWAA